MPGDDAGRPIQLLHQHRAGQHVRPCRLAERDAQAGRRAFLRGQAIGRADQKAQFARAGVAPVFDLLCEGGRGQLLACLIHRDNDRAGGRRRLLAASVGQLRDRKGPGDALGIALNQISLRSAPDLAAGDDVQLQLAGGASPNAHMRSRL